MSWQINRLAIIFIAAFHSNCIICTRFGLAETNWLYLLDQHLKLGLNTKIYEEIKKACFLFCGRKLLVFYVTRIFSRTNTLIAVLIGVFGVVETFNWQLTIITQQ